MAGDQNHDDRPASEENDDGRSDLVRTYEKVGPYLQIGWSLAAAMTLGCLGGWWLDKKLGTTPWLLILGAVLGMVAGFVELYRVVSKLNK